MLGNMKGTSKKFITCYVSCFFLSFVLPVLRFYLLVSFTYTYASRSTYEKNVSEISLWIRLSY